MGYRRWKKRRFPTPFILAGNLKLTEIVRPDKGRRSGREEVRERHLVHEGRIGSPPSPDNRRAGGNAGEIPVRRLTPKGEEKFRISS